VARNASRNEKDEALSSLELILLAMDTFSEDPALEVAWRQICVGMNRVSVLQRRLA
jgi:hypothetical protein